MITWAVLWFMSKYKSHEVQIGSGYLLIAMAIDGMWLTTLAANIQGIL